MEGSHLVVDDMVMERPHRRVSNGSTIALLRGLPVATLQIAGSRESHLDRTVYLENVIEHCICRMSIVVDTRTADKGDSQ